MTSSPPSSHLAAAVRAESPASPDGNCPQGLRSLWHLSRHLTARADDNHAAPPRRPRREHLFPSAPCAVQARVRFLAYHRIKPHVPPLVRAPVNSFEFHRLPAYSPGGALNAFAWPPAVLSPTASAHRLQCGLPGYLILFDTRTFVPQRQCKPGKLPARSEFFVISMHFTATPRIPPAPSALKPDSFNCSPKVGPWYFTADLKGRLRTL